MRLRQFNLFIMGHQSGDLWGINRLQHAREMSFTARLIFLSHIPHGLCVEPPAHPLLKLTRTVVQVIKSNGNKFKLGKSICSRNYRIIFCYFVVVINL